MGRRAFFPGVGVLFLPILVRGGTVRGGGSGDDMPLDGAGEGGVLGGGRAFSRVVPPLRGDLFFLRLGAADTEEAGDDDSGDDGGSGWPATGLTLLPSSCGEGPTAAAGEGEDEGEDGLPRARA